MMNKLEKLIHNFCPDGVEFCTFKEVMKYEQPTKYIVKNTDYNDSFETPVLTAGQTFVLGYTNEKNGIYNASKHSPVIIFDDFTGAFKWVDFPFKVKSSAIKILTVNESCTYTTLRYVYHVMGKLAFSSNEHKRLWIGIYSSFQLPLPPLPIQEEIVRILDNFTKLTAELTAELTARRKQYEHYRDVLLTQTNNVNIAELGSVCTFVRGPFGGALKKESFQQSGYAVYEQQHAIYHDLSFRYYIDDEKYKKLERFSVQPGDMIVSCSGTIGKTFVIPQEAPKGVINQALLKLTPNNLLNVYYLQFFFENTISKLLNSVARGGAIKNVPSVNELKKIKIPLPSLEEQQRIVDILDRFDKLCNDIREGLPAEIEARQKQYEYYRDKLLTFKPLEEVK